MAQVLSLATRQHLAISPRLQQAVRLLQMSALEFEQELREAMTENPFLEEEEQTPETEAPEPAALRELDPVWQDPTPPRTRPEDDGGEGADGSWAAATTDLRGHLRAQLCATPLDPRGRMAAEAVVEALDEDGYLRDDIAASAAALGIEPELSEAEIRAATDVVRGLDPAGVGATGLIDCLLLQLQAIEADAETRELASSMLRDHTDLLGRRDFAGLQQRLGCAEGELRAACALIRRLDPHPGRQFTATAPQYVVPDVLVVRTREGYQAVINPAVRPHARLNDRYIQLFRQSRRSGHPAMAQQLQEARWLLKNAEQRFATIQRVADAIVARQSAFFMHGDVALKPLVLREVADELGLHESTVSRATGNKFMDTPRGLFEFKHFFSRQLPTRNGNGCSAAAVRALISEIVQEEGTDAPLSDVIIADLLRKQGIQIARRTVSKYRRMMRLPAAEMRRQM